MFPPGTRLAHAQLAPSRTSVFDLATQVGNGWRDGYDDGNDSDSTDESNGSCADIAAAMSDLGVTIRPNWFEAPVGAMIKPEWYDGSLASMVAISNESCAICLLPLITGRPDERYPSGVGPNDWTVACRNRHAFHERCIARWNAYSDRCPECNDVLLLGASAPSQPKKPPLAETLAAIQRATDTPTPAEALNATRKAQEARREEQAVRQAARQAARKARQRARPSRRGRVALRQ